MKVFQAEDIKEGLEFILLCAFYEGRPTDEIPKELLAKCTRLALLGDKDAQAWIRKLC